ncbi:MAG: hypothetical protein IJE05_03060 [Clostridia bacterium]|nr:hypothetical protein [Clostridia bacterium]
MNSMVLATLIGVFLIIFFIILKYLKLKCYKEIEAIYVKSNAYSSGTGGHGLVTQYAPVFKYNFNGKEYEKQTFQTFSKKYIKNLIVGEKYNILIDERKPSRFVINKKSRNDEILILLMGIFLIIAGIICMVNMYN